MPADAVGMLYFWYRLPFAVPGAVTFIVGLIAAFVGLHRLWKKEHIGYMLSISGTYLGFGTLGLLTSLSAVIQDEILLLNLTTCLYPVALTAAPFSFHLAYYLLDKNCRVLQWVAGLNWITTLIGLFGILGGEAFAGSSTSYSFGIYPAASIYVEIWGAVAAAGYFLVGLPAYYLYLKRNSFRERRLAVIGHNLLFILLISSLPCFISLPVFPVCAFSLVPMCLLAYGISNSDFSDYKRLLLDRSVLFYVFNILLSGILILIAGVVLFHFSPEDYDRIHWYPWLLIPLVSIFVVVGLGIFIGGTNPYRPLNQLGSLSLYLYGFQLLATLGISISLEPIVGRRIEQLSYLVFCLAPSIHMRFTYLSLNMPAPRNLRLFDLSSLMLCAMSLSPYLFTGYYRFPWGNFSASGPVIQIFGFVAITAFFTILHDWWKLRRKKASNAMGNFAALYVVIGGLMILCNLPATLGFNFYPAGNLSIIPTSILAFAVIRYGGKNVRTEALRISSYLVPFALFFIALFVTYVAHTLPAHVPIQNRILHILLLGIPLTLLGFMATFILLRPISNRVDQTMQSLLESRRIAELQKLETEKSKQEIEDLNHLIKNLNEDLDIHVIMKKVHGHIKSRYSINYYGLAAVDKENNELVTRDTSSPDFLTQEEKRRINNSSTKVNTSIGAHSFAFKTKKAFYIPDTFKRKSGLSPEEHDVFDTLKMESLLIIPLILQNELIGFFDLYNVGKMDLTKQDITRLSILGEQLAGIIHRSNLFKQAEKEKIAAEKAHGEVEKLNEFTKLINSTSDLSLIFKEIYSYLNQAFGFNNIWTLLINKETNEIYSDKKIAQSDYESEIDSEFFNNFRIKLEPAAGTFYQTFQKKIPLYIPDIKETIAGTRNKYINQYNGDVYEGSKTDVKIIIKGKLTTIIQIPLILRNEVIGILNLSSYGKRLELSREEVDKLIRFGNQVAGVLYNAQLLKETEEARRTADREKQKSENLLLNILPEDVASELKEKGSTDPVHFDSVSVMFTDFIGFTRIAEMLSPQELIKDLDACFVQFDKITERFNLEKLKTIGDSYMAAGGIPRPNKTHAIDCILAALEIQAFMNTMKDIKANQGLPYWALRLGIHTGPLVAGVIGEKKFAYDVWGDTVNTASRMESSGAPGRINISGSTHEIVKDLFVCEYRGRVNAKNKGEVEMYYVDGIKPEFSVNGEGKVPSQLFWQMHRGRGAI